MRGIRVTRPGVPTDAAAAPPALVRRDEEVHIDLDGGALAVVPAPGVADDARGLVILLHGAGSGTDSGALVPLREHLLVAGFTVARLEMPYRVAGRRAPDRPARLDAVLRAAVATLAAAAPSGSAGPIALAGRSMGARVACRGARDAGACCVLALGFPLRPPARAGAVRASRIGELRGAGVPVLVVQGERDAFGRPEPEPAVGVEVRIVAGADHSFATRKLDGRPPGAALQEAAAVGADWLGTRLAAASSAASGASTGETPAGETRPAGGNRVRQDAVDGGDRT